jgi:hypothetical protein
MRTAVCLRNGLPTLAASGGSGGVPYCVLHGAQADLSHLKVFGCSAYLRLEDQYRGKLSPKALRVCSSGTATTVLAIGFST